MFTRRLAVAVALIAGVIGSQGPEFAEQYRQRMGGALDELKRIVAQFDAAAAHQGLTTTQALSRLEQNAEPLAREQGQDMMETIARADRLDGELEAMRSAGPLRRIYVMGKHFDPDLARGTLDNYEPAVPLSFEADWPQSWVGRRRILPLGRSVEHAGRRAVRRLNAHN